MRVVLYDRAVNMWAARVWWMLRAFGFDDAAVLNGGFKKWTVEKRAVATDDGARPAATFTPRPRPALIADKAGVLAGSASRATCVLNALSAEQHRGTGGVTYGRPGRIAGSVNVVAARPGGSRRPTRTCPRTCCATGSRRPACSTPAA